MLHFLHFIITLFSSLKHVTWAISYIYLHVAKDDDNDDGDNDDVDGYMMSKLKSCCLFLCVNLRRRYLR